MASGWNRSGSSSGNDSKKRGDGRANVHLRGIVAGLIVVLGAAGVWWLVGNGPAPERKDAEGKVNRRIKEVTPAAAPKPKAEEKPVAKKERPQIAGEIRNGYRLLANGRLHKVVGVHTSRVARVSLADKVFDQPADQSIASLLIATPGSSFLGDSSMYYKDFDKHFAESLKTEIKIEPDDTDEVKELKQAVIDTRKELKALMDSGKDLAEVMRESREQLRELGLYKEELHKQVLEIAGNVENELSEKDLNDLIGAANKMLEERGSEPLIITAPALYQIREDKLSRTFENQEENK